MSSTHLLRRDGQLLCPHGGKLQLPGGDGRVKVDGLAVLTTADVAAISGCTLGTNPCATTQWIPAARVRIGGSPAALASAGQLARGLCIGVAPQGSPTTLSNQTRVKGQ